MTRQSASKSETPLDGGSSGVSPRGRMGGLLDTVGGEDRRLSSRRLWKMLVASLVVHVFLTPGPALLGFISLLPAVDLSGPSDLVEIDLTALPMAPPGEQPKPPTKDAEPKAEPQPSAEDADSSEPLAQAPSEREIEKEAPAPSPEPVAPPSPPPASDSEQPGPTKAFGDPVALAGSAGEIADSNANVRLMLYTSVVREHPLGDKISGLLKRTPQWKDFFGPSKIDPVRDIERVMIAGPQLRDSSQVVAVVEHALPQQRIEQAFDSLVQRKGKWIDRQALIASGKADRAWRIFAAPSPHLVVVAPPQLEQQVRAMKSDAGFPKNAGDIAVSAYLVTPHRALRGTGILIPETIAWARIDLRPLPDGGALLKVLAEDKDADSARNDAELIESLIVQATSMNFSRMGGLGAIASLAFGGSEKKWLKSVSFRSEKEMIHGVIEVTRDQLATATDLLEAFLPPESPDEPTTVEAPKQVTEGKGAPEGKTEAVAKEKPGPPVSPPPAVPDVKVEGSNPTPAPDREGLVQPEGPPAKEPNPAPQSPE